MKRFALCAALLFAHLSLAQDAGSAPEIALVDSGISDAAAPVADAGIPGPSALVPAGTVTVTSSDGGTVQIDPLANPLGSVKEFYVAVKSGNYWWAAALLLFAVVGLLRLWGKKLHDWLPDNNPLDTPLYFLFDTKIGGWVFNWATSISMCLIASASAGVAVDMGAWKTALFISTSGTALVELWKDIKEWWAARKAKQAAAATPAVAAVPPKP